MVEPAQLSSGAFDLSTALLLETLVPDPAEADAGIWLAVGNTLTAFSGQGTTEARKGVTRTATKMVTACTLNCAKEHPYLLDQNVALVVVGFVPTAVTGPFLGCWG